MRGVMSKEPSFWWPIPLAVVVWLALLWGLGIFLQSPTLTPSPPPAIDVRLVELPETRPTQKKAVRPAVLAPKPRLAARPKLQPPQLAPPRPEAPQPDLAPPVPPEPVPRPVLPLNLERSIEPAPTDMLSYVNAKRARRQAEEMAIARSAENSIRQPSADEVRLANVRRNLQPGGTNGIFQILDIQPRTARFSFRAWMSSDSNPRRETITVDAGPGEDIRLAIIRRMIGLIRIYNSGDFNWESQRLGQVVVMSAREEDTLQLEDFLMREFFSVGIKNRAH